VTTEAPAIPAEAATASRPEPLSLHGRSDSGAAVARTEALYEQYTRLVSGLCRALLRDRAEAEDAAQQTFLAAHRALLNGSTPREPAAWLATIARNECWGRIRTRMREPLPTADVDTEVSSSDPLEEAIRNADLAAMWRAIAELPRQQRDALLLREFGGLSYEELAAALVVSGSAVESLLFRARQGVRVRLKTVYAGVTGASWLESLTRLAGGLGGSMAPVAAKAVAVGVGAAVVTGGAVGLPRVLDQQQHRAPRTRPAPVHATTAERVPVLALAPQSRPVVVSTRRAERASTAERSASADEHSSGDQKNSGDTSQSGDQQAAVPERSQQGDSSPQDGGEPGSTPSGNSGGDGSAQSSDGGGDGSTTTNPVVTVTVPTGDQPPVDGGPAPGTDS
jgi:RNA polymerase sigma factor (sigma-70 family)